MMNEAVFDMGHDNANRGYYLQCLANALAVNIIPADHPEYPIALAVLANCLNTKFQMTGLLEDLNSSISMASRAVDATPAGNENLATYLRVLSESLHLRYVRLGSMDDLGRPIEIITKAIDMLPREHDELAQCLDTLSRCLCIRYPRTQSVDDLSRAIDVNDEAISLCSAATSSYILSLYTRAGLLDGTEFGLATPPRHKKDILAHMQKCTIFHFAGHGGLDSADPSQSKLLLDDW